MNSQTKREVFAKLGEEADRIGASHTALIYARFVALRELGREPCNPIQALGIGKLALKGPPNEG